MNTLDLIKDKNISLSEIPEKKVFPENKIERVAFFGFADALPDDPLYSLTYTTAKLVAEKGFTVVDGGGPGVMEAASRGAKEGGGKTIGVTFYPSDAVHFEGRSKNNPLDEEIITKNYIERTLRLLEYGQVYMIFQGGTGTISEFGMAWGLARIYFGHHKPLILVGKWWEEIIQVFVKTMRIREEELKVFSIADTPEEAVEILVKLDMELAVRDTATNIADNEKAFIL